MAAGGATASIALLRPLGQNIATPHMIDRNNDHNNSFRFLKNCGTCVTF